MKPRLTKQVTIDVEVSPEELAKLFCNMASDEQTKFFNEIGRLVKTEWTAPFCMQMAFIRNEELTIDGRHIMSTIGEYAR